MPRPVRDTGDAFSPAPAESAAGLRINEGPRILLPIFALNSIIR